MSRVCSAISSCFQECNTMRKDGATYCYNCWWTPESRFTEEAIAHADLKKLRVYDLLTRITFAALVAAEIAGFVLLAVAQKTPPPFHPLIGLYVCVGAAAVSILALCIIGNRQMAYEKSIPGLDGEPTHREAESDSDSDED